MEKIKKDEMSDNNAGAPTFVEKAFNEDGKDFEELISEIIIQTINGKYS